MIAALTGRLRRVTNGQVWIPQIDGLRFLAIAAVLLFHLWGQVDVRSGRILPIEDRYYLFHLFAGNADRGVRLFFVISGFVLALPFARHHLAGARPVLLRNYYMRRVTRLEPPYLISLLLLTLMVGVWTHSFGLDLWRHSAASALYLHNGIYGSVSTINMVAWSLETEVQFYVLAPLLMQVFRVGNVWVRRGFLLLLILACGPLGTAALHSPHTESSLLRYLGYFLGGLLTADFFVLGAPLDRQAPRFDAYGFLLLLIAFSVPHDSEAVHSLLPLVFAGLCLASMRGPLFNRVLSQPAIAVIGGMCYSIYLLHMAVIAMVFKGSKYLISTHLDFMGNYIIQCIILIPCVLVACTAFYLVVERPCMDPRWPSKLRQHLTRTVAPIHS